MGLTCSSTSFAIVVRLDRRRELSINFASDLTSAALQKRSVRGAAITFVTQMIRFILRLAAQILIARLLIPSDYGLIAMAAPFVGLLQLVSELGLTQAVVQSDKLRPTEINTLFWFTLAINTLVGIGIMTFSPLISLLYREPRLITVCLVLGLLFPITGASALPFALLNRQMYFERLAIIETTSPLVSLVVGLLTAKIGWGYLALLTASAAEGIYVTALLFTLCFWRPQWPDFDKRAITLIKTGGQLTVFNLAQYVTSTADNLAVAIFNGTTALGLYDRGYKMVAQPLAQIMTPAHRVVLPLLSRQLRSEGNYRKSYLSILQTLLMCATPPLLFLLFFSPEITIYLLGKRWASIWPIISWLCFGGLASVVYSSTSWLFVSQGRARKQMLYGVLTSSISMFGFMAGLPWGPDGVAAGAGISFFFISTPLACWGATQEGHVSPIHIIDIVLPALVAAVIMGVVCVLYRFTISASSDPTFLILEAPASTMIFFAALFCFQDYRSLTSRLWRLRHQLLWV